MHADIITLHYRVNIMIYTIRYWKPQERIGESNGPQ